jgi:hypothetical protein
MRKIKFDSEKYNFKEIIQSIFDKKLEELHENLDVFNPDTDQSTKFHKKYYDEIKNTNFYEIYKNFVKNVIEPEIGEDVLYQTIPTFRVHMKGNLGVGAFHRDSEYSHNTHEINIFLPVTDAYGNNTIWSESKRDNSDFKPMEAKYGEIYIWDGANLMHGNKINDTEQTRVSFDFRILPKSKYNENEIKESITNKTKMKIGEYWSEL